MLQDANFNYGQVIGEVIYDVVPYRPDSLRCHETVRVRLEPGTDPLSSRTHFMKYLALTKYKGITQPDQCVSHSENI